MDNPTRILTALDAGLDHQVELVLYGRAAVWLGFPNPPMAVASTLDVDAILRTAQLPALEADTNFWQAVDSVNIALASDGLYLSHLFAETQVILRRGWEQHIVRIKRPLLNRLVLHRPATIDLILTKMMRGGDPQDMDDVEFMLRTDSVDMAQLEQAFSEANGPDVPEIWELFHGIKPKVLAMAAKISKTNA